MTRRIFPVVGVVTADGYRRMSDSDVAAVADESPEILRRLDAAGVPAGHADDRDRFAGPFE